MESSECLRTLLDPWLRGPPYPRSTAVAGDISATDCKLYGLINGHAYAVLNVVQVRMPLSWPRLGQYS